MVELMSLRDQRTWPKCFKLSHSSPKLLPCSAGGLLGGRHQNVKAFFGLWTLNPKP